MKGKIKVDSTGIYFPDGESMNEKDSRVYKCLAFLQMNKTRNDRIKQQILEEYF